MESRKNWWFSSLKRSKLLCRECGDLKRFVQYSGDGMVVLECGHSRPAREPTLTDRNERKIEKVIKKLGRDD